MSSAKLQNTRSTHISLCYNIYVEARIKSSIIYNCSKENEILAINLLKNTWWLQNAMKEVVDLNKEKYHIHGLNNLT